LIRQQYSGLLKPAIGEQLALEWLEIRD